MKSEQQQFTIRFRRVSTRYPRRVAEAYGGDTARAMRDSDEQVAATVAAWEQEQGAAVVRDWEAVGRKERSEKPARKAPPTEEAAMAALKEVRATRVERSDPKRAQAASRVINRFVSDKAKRVRDDRKALDRKLKGGK